MLQKPKICLSLSEQQTLDGFCPTPFTYNEKVVIAVTQNFACLFPLLSEEMLMDEDIRCATGK